MGTANLTGTYQKYKADTSWFISWLVYTATSLGYHSETLSRNKLKAGKRAYKAKQKEQTQGNASSDRTVHESKYPVSSKELLALAQFIAQQKKCPRIPSIAIDVLQSVIKHRQQCHESYKQQAAEPESDDSHANFIAALQDICAVLQPLSIPRAETGKATNTTTNCSPAELEDAPEGTEFDDSILLKQQILLTEFQRPKLPDCPMFEAEAMRGPSEVAFAATDLINDFRIIKCCINDAWQDYKDGDVNLVSAAIVTDISLNIMAKLERQFYEEFADGPSPLKLLELFSHYASCNADRWTTYETTRRTDEILSGAKSYPLDPLLFVDECAALFPLNDKTLLKNSPLYRRVPPIRSDSHSDDPSASSLIMLALTEIMFEALGLQNRESLIVSDVFCKSVLLDKENERFSLTSLCGAIISISILYVLHRESIEPFSHLQSITRSIKSSLNATLNEKHQDLSAVEVQELRKFLKGLDRWIMNDGSQNHVQATLNEFGIKKERPIFHGFNRYPVICGLTLFKQLHTFHEMGFARIQKTLTVFNAAFLYKILHTFGILSHPWQDMDRFVDFHPFVRILLEKKSDGPSTIYDHYDWYLRSLKPHLNLRQRVSNEEGSGISPLNIVQFSRILREAYCRDGDIDDLTLAALEHSVTAFTESLAKKVKLPGIDSPDNFSCRLDSITPNRKNRRKQSFEKAESRSKERARSFSETFTLLSCFIGNEAAQMSFDYFDFHRQCEKLLVKVKSQVLPLLYSFDSNQADLQFLYFTDAFLKAAAVQHALKEIIPPTIIGAAGRAIDQALSSSPGCKTFCKQNDRLMREGLVIRCGWLCGPSWA